MKSGCLTICFPILVPDVSSQEYKSLLAVNSKEIISAYIEPSLNEAQPEEFFQFERSGYFVADQLDMKDR